MAGMCVGQENERIGLTWHEADPCSCSPEQMLAFCVEQLNLDKGHQAYSVVDYLEGKTGVYHFLLF